VKYTNSTCIIPVEIGVLDYETRLPANIGNQLCDLFDISSLADQKRAAKIVDKLGMINMSGHYGQMNIKVASKVLDKFLRIVSEILDMLLRAGLHWISDIS
jgi:hypothetical protein